MNQAQSDAITYPNGEWGTVEYAELECAKCFERKNMIFFARNSHFQNAICAECWWKYQPQELGIRSKVEGVKPATIVQLGEVSIEHLEAEVLKTRETHGNLLHQYHKVWYEAPFTWPYTHFLGIGMMKCPNDLWAYQALMTKHKPKTIIETGTYAGASALWFAFLMDMLRIDGGRIFTIDFEDHRTDPRIQHPRITFLAGNSVDPTIVEAIEQEIDGPLLVCLDSDHSSEHVRKELELYAPLCKVGDWLVVEDTNIGWSDGKDHTVTFKGDLGKCRCGLQFMLMTEMRGGEKIKCPHDKNDMGARGGLVEYMDKHPGEWRQDILSERYLLTMNPGGWLQRIGECTHG